MQDENFPYLNEDQRIEFPSVDQATSEGIVCAGANLSPGVLLSAYEQGLFPWYDPRDQILWWCPDPRYVITPESLHISRSMKRLFKQRAFAVTFDRDFLEVLRGCRDIKRSHEDGTWISEEIESGYVKLHELGVAHSVEVWRDEELVGGLYGVCVGNVFCGETMFARVSNASKYGFLTLASSLFARGCPLIDSQTRTEHLVSLGAGPIPRQAFLTIVAASVVSHDWRGDWEETIPKVYPY